MLQIPRQVAADEDKHSDRVRLPGSLFETLQGNQSVIRLAVMVLDIGHGNLFKVRRGLMALRAAQRRRVCFIRDLCPSLFSLDSSLQELMGLEGRQAPAECF